MKNLFDKSFGGLGIYNARTNSLGCEQNYCQFIYFSQIIFITKFSSYMVSLKLHNLHTCVFVCYGCEHFCISYYCSVCPTYIRSALLDPFIPEFITSRLTSYHVRLTTKPPSGEQGRVDIIVIAESCNTYVNVMLVMCVHIWDFW